MPHGGQETRAARSGAGPMLVELAGLLASAGLGIVLYLWTPIERGLAVPFGADTPAHLWRARLVVSQGFNALFGSSSLNFQVNPDRIGLPVLASVLTGVGVTPWRLMFIIPALSAGILAAAAWALARAVPEPPWGAAIYAVAVATSIPFAVTTRSNLDNALADGLIVAAAAAALLAAGRERGTAAGTILLAGGLLMHWPAASLFALALGLFTVLLVPSAVVEWRGEHPLWSSGATRVAAIVGGGLVLGGLPLLLTPGANLPDEGTGRFFRGNVQRLLPLFRLPITLGLAGIGAVRLLVAAPREPRRRALLLAAAWLVPIGVASIAYARGSLVPLMRFFQVAFPIPILGAGVLVGLLVAAGRVRAAPAVRTALVSSAALVAGGVLVVAVWLAHEAAADARPSVTPEQLGPIRAATAFLAQTGAPAATIVADGDPGLPFRRVRMLASGPTIDRIGVFPGTADELFEQASGPPDPIDPSLAGGALKRAQIAADGVARMRVDGAVAIALRPFIHGYDRLARDPRNVEIADGVVVLRAAGAPPPVSVPPLTPPRPAALVLATLASFAALSVAGSGWSALLLAGPWTLRLAFAPAVGLAASILAGTAFGLAGANTDHGAGLVVLGSTAAAGWVALATRRHRPHQPRDASGASAVDPAV
jgi:hypothetical protein